LTHLNKRDALAGWRDSGAVDSVCHAGLRYKVESIFMPDYNTTNSSGLTIRVSTCPMAKRRKPQISLRKQPKQARSTELVSIILEAAVQVLAKEGAQRFTTARVAKKAGFSVGSLYQYFPNKAAILFRLQSDEWRQTSELLRGILEDEDAAL
jgi:hypothetical protein